MGDVLPRASRCLKIEASSASQASLVTLVRPATPGRETVIATPSSIGEVTKAPLAGQNEVDSLISGYKWGVGIGAGASLTYSIRNTASTYSSDSTIGYGPANGPGSGEIWQAWKELTAKQVSAIHEALGAWAEIANLTFAEVIDSATVAGNIRFSTGALVDTAKANEPALTAAAGDIWFGFATNLDNPDKGTYAYLVFLHEVGHALGLKHPHQGAVIADPAVDALPFSIMSYRDFVGDAINSLTSRPYPTTPMLHDIAAMQYLYGANTGTRSGDTVYRWAPKEKIYETIWDGGGIDVIDWSNQTTPARINLNPGAWSTLGPARWDGLNYTHQNLAIARNVVIENALGGAGNDTLVGNNAKNRLNGGPGDDFIDGGGGIDVAVYSAARSQYKVGPAGPNRTVSGPDGTDTLANIERLQFADGALAIDVAAGQPANTAYGMYKAAFKRAPDTTGLLYWANAIDSGATPASIASGFMGSAEFRNHYGTSPTHSDFLTKVYDNVLGRAPDPAGFKFWLGHLDASHLTRSELLASFSQSPENQLGVTGLIQDGIWLTA